MKLGLYGKKIGMTQIFDAKSASAIPVTVVQIFDATVLEHRSAEKNGYSGLVLAFDETKAARLNKAKKGYLQKFTDKNCRSIREVRVSDASIYPCGALLTLQAFSVGDRVNVIGISKGKGFQGVIKRHGKGGGPAAHGSGFHRTTGSIGQRTYPGRVFKNMGMAGRMGGEQIKTKNLEIVGLDEAEKVIFIKGAVPGSISGLVFVETQKKTFDSGIQVPAQAQETSVAGAEA